MQNLLASSLGLCPLRPPAQIGLWSLGCLSFHLDRIYFSGILLFLEWPWYIAVVILGNFAPSVFQLLVHREWKVVSHLRGESTNHLGNLNPQHL